VLTGSQRTSGTIDVQGGEVSEKHYHPCSREAKKIKLTDQPWYRPGVTRKQSDEYLANTPPGAFVVRPAAAGDSHVMDVQAGPRIGHVLLTHANIDGVTYYHLPGTPHYFEHVYDLVLFCHYNPFIFEKIDGQIVITLSIAMAKKAEKINVVRVFLVVVVLEGLGGGCFSTRLLAARGGLVSEVAFPARHGRRYSAPSLCSPALSRSERSRRRRTTR
jgi:hypothetical protein